jgi:hypothetical protein
MIFEMKNSFWQDKYSELFMIMLYFLKELRNIMLIFENYYQIGGKRIENRI